MMRVACACSLFVFFTLTASVSADDAKKKELTDLLGKLKEKRSSGGVQTYKIEFEHKGANGTCQTIDEITIDWATGRFHKVCFQGCRDPYELTKVFDGEKTKTKFRSLTRDGKPVGDGSWKYGIDTGRMNSGTFPREYWPVFFRKGVIAGWGDLFYPGHLKFDPDVDKLFVEGSVNYDGRKCVSVRTFPENPTDTRQYDYIIDPNRDYSVLRHVLYAGGVPSYEMSVNYRLANNGRSVPTDWTYIALGANGPVVTTKAKVISFVEVGEVDPKLFTIVPPEGAKVGRNHYDLPPGAQDQKIDHYEYKVTGGELIQTLGPVESVYSLRRYWSWAARLGADAAVALLARGGRGSVRSREVR